MAREPESVLRLRERALRNDPVAQYELGDLFRRGGTVPRDLDQAVVWLVRAARHGHREAATRLDDLRAQGVAVDRPVDDLPSPVGAGHIAAARPRGPVAFPPRAAPPAGLFLPEPEVESDPLSVGGRMVDLTRLSVLAETGDPAALVALGDACRDGIGRAPDLDQAVRFYSRAAETGDARGQYALGVMYDLGLGVAADAARALAWYHAAAAQGDAPAQYNLGNMIRQGRGTAADPAQAAQWFHRAADQGEAAAQLALATLYEAGEGVARDEARAVELYRQAAEQGGAQALFNLANMVRQGRGTEPDPVEAAALCRRAAEQGLAPAQVNYGLMLGAGLGVERDERAAVHWLRRAAAAGDALARRHLEGLGEAVPAPAPEGSGA